MQTEDNAYKILLESAREAFITITREDSTYEFSEKDFLELIKALWQDRFKSEQLAFKDKCVEILLREGIDADK